MSKFRIYGTDNPDPRMIGRRNRKLYLAFSIILFALLFSIQFEYKVREDQISGTAYLIFEVCLFITLVTLLLLIRRQSGKLRKIGTLEFTATFMKKEIGDLLVIIPYDRITRIEMQKHIRSLTIYGSRTGFITYLMKIVQNDMTVDNLIISDKAYDFSRTDILSTLRILKSTAGIHYVIR